MLDIRPQYQVIEYEGLGDKIRVREYPCQENEERTYYVRIQCSDLEWKESCIQWLQYKVHNLRGNEKVHATAALVKAFPNDSMVRYTAESILYHLEKTIHSNMVTLVIAGDTTYLKSISIIVNALASLSVIKASTATKLDAIIQEVLTR